MAVHARRLKGEHKCETINNNVVGATSSDGFYNCQLRMYFISEKDLSLSQQCLILNTFSRNVSSVSQR